MIEFKFAGMDGVDEVTLSSLHVKVGQTLKKGDNLFDIEADKAADTITSPYDGIISKINFAAGDAIKTGDIVIEFDGATSAAKVDQSSEVVKESTTKSTIPQATSPELGQEFSKVVLATPIARKVARDLGVDITAIRGTGPNGRVLRADIEGAHSNNNVKSTPVAVTSNVNKGNNDAINVAKLESFGTTEHQPLSPIRKAIVNHMTLSKYTAPHVSLMIDVDATNLIAMRAVLKDETIKPENGAVKLTFMPFFVKAVAKALSEDRFKALNSTLNLKDNELLVKKYYNIGMAADTDKGLLVPVIKSADKLSVLEIAKQVNDLAQKARTGTLNASEMQGGTFTITNFGSAGLKYGTPIINYPEVAILGIGILETKAVLENDKVVFHNFFPLSISIDHRVVDGAPAGYFMQRIKYLLENPALLLLS